MMFISKYKTITYKVREIQKDGQVCYGSERTTLPPNTPFNIHDIHAIESFGFHILTLDGKYGIIVNSDVLRIGFSETEFLIGE